MISSHSAAIVLLRSATKLESWEVHCAPIWLTSVMPLVFCIGLAGLACAALIHCTAECAHRSLEGLREKSECTYHKYNASLEANESRDDWFVCCANWASSALELLPRVYEFILRSFQTRGCCSQPLAKSCFLVVLDGTRSTVCLCALHGNQPPHLQSFRTLEFL